MAQGTLPLSTGTTGSPSMPLTATMASANPTWASCGVPATMSPTAQTPVDAGALVLVGHHEAAFVDLDAHPVGHQPFGAGAPAHRHHDGLHVELCSPAATVVTLPSFDGVCPSTMTRRSRCRCRAW